jgi:TRAP-type C4-dicarboxylate transport system permease small subunit
MIDTAANALERTVFQISRIVGSIGMSMIVVITFLTIADIIMRRVLNSPMRGSHELTELIFAIITFLTLAYCAIKDGHIEVDILVNKFPQKLQSTISVIILLATSGTLGLVSWQLVKYAMNLQQMKQTTVSLGIAVYPFAFLAALGAFLITLVYFIQFLYSLARFKGG